MRTWGGTLWFLLGQKLQGQGPYCRQKGDNYGRMEMWPPDAFEQWWKVYKLKEDKKFSRTCFDRVRKSREITFDDLVYATKQYMAEYDRPEDPKKFRPPMKYPATWLNKGGWSKYLDRTIDAMIGKVEIRRFSSQAMAWQQYRGKDFPWGPSGVWMVESEWPPMEQT